MESYDGGGASTASVYVGGVSRIWLREERNVEGFSSADN